MQATISRADIPFALIERIRRDSAKLGIVLFQDNASTPLDLTGKSFRLKLLKNGVTVVEIQNAAIVRTTANRLEITLTSEQKALLIQNEHELFLYEDTQEVTYLEGIFRWVKARPSTAPGLQNPPDIGIIYDTTNSIVLRTVLVLQGPQGYKAWEPVHAVVIHGLRRVLQVVDWRNGTGPKPTDTPFLGATGYVSAIGDAVDVRGPQGLAAWTPVLSLNADGLRWVLRVSDWTGGEGNKPATGMYLGASGFVSAIGDAIDIRGRQGTTWSSAAAAPSAGAGIDGDFHMHRTSGDIYFKSGNAWAVVGNMRGPAGTLISSGLPEISTFQSTDKIVVQGADTALKKVTREVFLNLPTTGYPDVRPSLALDFANSKQVSPLVTCARAGVLSYYDALGTLRSAPANTPAIDHDPATGRCLGLSIWPSRQNLMWSSGSLTTGINISNATRELNFPAPDGTNTATKLVENTATSTHYFASNTVSTFSDNNIVCLSVYAKAVERSLVVVQGKTKADTYPSATFNLATGAISAAPTVITSKLTPLPGGWFRCSITFSVSTGSAQVMGFFMLHSGVGVNYQGDGTSGALFWGGQLEDSGFETPYVLTTTTAAVTRGAENCSLVTGSWYNPLEGTLYAEVLPSTISPYSNIGVVSLTDGTANNGYNLFAWRGGNAQLLAKSGGANQAQLSVGAYSPTLTRIAATYKQGEFKAVKNGGLVQSQASGILATVNRLNLGMVDGGSFFLNGWIANVRYYPKALTDAQLQLLTSL